MVLREAESGARSAPREKTPPSASASGHRRLRRHTNRPCSEPVVLGDGTLPENRMLSRGRRGLTRGVPRWSGRASQDYVSPGSPPPQQASPAGAAPPLRTCGGGWSWRWMGIMVLAVPYLLRTQKRFLEKPAPLAREAGVPFFFLFPNIVSM